MAGEWTAERIPDQRGRVAVVTGSSSGLGLVVARELAHAGARVVVAVRDRARGEAAARRIARGPVEVAELDLASLESVRRFAERFRATHDGLDLLVNNAGIMATPRGATSDGFDLQLGTNHLGHFALTARLLDRMEGLADARVVTVSSTAHRMGSIDFGDLNWARGYGRWRAYARSKLANLLFAFELDRRLRARGSSVKSVAAHPGYAATNLHASASRLDRAVIGATKGLLAQDPEMGALPLLHAATEPGLEGGSYVGPGGFGGWRGHPRVVEASAAARDESLAERLWTASEELTGVRFALPAAA